MFCCDEQLRDIEILVQAQLEVLEGLGKEDETLKDIQKILYSTEVRLEKIVLRSYLIHHFQEGFEVPEGGAAVDEEETF
jgi:RP/EB family microtubule-associated protein